MPPTTRSSSLRSSPSRRRCLRALAPWLLVPSIVLEILFGVAVGPHVLGWAHVDGAVQVFSDVGLAMLLFLAGMEIDLDRLRGRNLRLALGGFGVSCVLASASAALPRRPVCRSRPC